MKTEPLQRLLRSTLWLGSLLLALPALAQQLPAAPAAPAASAAVTVQTPAPAALLPFADFFKMPMGSKGAEMTPTLLQADGQRVRLTGYMVQQEKPLLGHFMLTPRPVRMSEDSDGDADDLPAAWVMVTLAPEQQDFAVPYQRGLLELTGRLRVGRLEAQDGRVSWVRLQLEPEATRGMHAFEVSNYLHSLQHVH